MCDSALIRVRSGVQVTDGPPFNSKVNKSKYSASAGLIFITTVMAYWWVNQNQTAQQEISGGYLWSPKREADGKFSQFYENMRLVRPGDIVFSYYKQYIQHVGVVQRPAISINKPNFGAVGHYWNDIGWLVAVSWKPVSKPFRPKDIFVQLKPTLPTKYSPLNSKNGDGLQKVYLASVPEEMAEILLEQLIPERARLTERVHNITPHGDIDLQLDLVIEQDIQNNTAIGITEKEMIILARRGQGRYRINLEKIENCCRVTGVRNPKFLRASHIKPWRYCENSERLDGFNGLLLAPHIDHVFDLGFITFEDNGNLIISKFADKKALGLLDTRIDDTKNFGAFKSEQQYYLDFHRHFVFMS